MSVEQTDQLTATVREQVAGVRVAVYPVWDLAVGQILSTPPDSDPPLWAQVTVGSDDSVCPPATITRTFSASQLRALEGAIRRGRHELEDQFCAISCRPRRESGDTSSHWAPCALANLLEGEGE